MLGGALLAALAAALSEVQLNTGHMEVEENLLTSHTHLLFPPSFMSEYMF